MTTTTHVRAAAGSAMDPNGEGAGLDPHSGG